MKNYLSSTALKHYAQRALFALVSVALIIQPLYSAAVFGSLMGLLTSPFTSLAQTPPPGPPRPNRAAEGQELGESLLHGPTTDDKQVFFNGADGTQALDVNELFQPGGSADDAQA